jgi:hypothetical protein
VIALALGGRTVAEWQASMSQSEFLAWRDFYMAFPFDDFHKHMRPQALVAHSMSGGDMRDLLEWLQPEPATVHLSDADKATMRAFGFGR